MGTRTGSPSGSRVRRHPLRLALIAATAALAIALPVLALAPHPAAGAAAIDGDPSEWVIGDFFAEMKHEGSTKVAGSLSVRYDCDTGVLSALVQAAEGVTFRADRPENAYVRIDEIGKLVSGESGNDGTPPDFAWIGLDGDAALGYEASGVVAPGEHTIRVHVLMADDSEDGGYLTVDSSPRTGPLTLVCGEPTGEPAATDSAPPSDQASATPSGSIAAEEGSPTPTGKVLAATGVPVTPPPTDLVGGGQRSPLLGLWFMVIGLALLNGLALAHLLRTKR